MVPTPVVAAVLVPLVLWRVYQRVRRLTVRQQSHLWRHRISLCVFPPLILFTLFSASGSILAMAGMLTGIIGGSLLGLAALERTNFERDGEEFYFTPFAPIGLVVAALFLARLAWRMFQLYQSPGVPENFARSPLTLLVFGILAGYYMTNSYGLLRWRKHSLES